MIRKRPIPPLTLGWRMQVALAHAGITREEIALALGVSHATVSRWMHDRGPVRTVYLNEWALICNVDPEWLKNDPIPAPRKSR
jgi:transcriptional regulator with XRE-family HTH domain